MHCWGRGFLERGRGDDWEVDFAWDLPRAIHSGWVHRNHPAQVERSTRSFRPFGSFLLGSLVLERYRTPLLSPS